MDYITVVIGIILLPVIAQIYIKVIYSSCSKIKTGCEKTGYDVAREILDKHGLNDILIVETSGTLSDHYDPKRKVVRLSKEIYHGISVASISIAAHEVGHAIQDKEGYIYLKIRSLLVPVVNISSTLAFLFIFLGFFLEMINLVDVGIVAVAFGLLLQLVTLPVEFNASKKAKAELSNMEFRSNETQGSVSMLRAAALTYVAGFLASVLQLLRLIMIRNSRD